MIARALAAVLGCAFLLGAHSAISPATLAQSIKHHPLYPVLAQYDREIAALRATETMPGLSSIASATTRSGVAIRRESDTARRTIAGLAANANDDYRRRELDALAALLTPRAQSQELAGYQAQLAHETETMLAAYRDGIAERTRRALAARAQALREKESTAAFDAAQRNAGRELALRLKLGYLHLDASARTQLKGELAALRSNDLARAQALRNADVAVLAAYRAQLQRDAANDIARMTAQLRAKASENLSLRRGIFESESAAPGDAPADLSAKATAFRNGYRFPANATEIESAFLQASGDLSARLSRLQRADQSSRTTTDAQITVLETERRALYRTIVASLRH